MSTNINIKATRKISYTKKDGSIGNDVQSTYFDCVQTPTDVTNAIMDSVNKLSAYIDYVKSLSTVRKVPLYAEDDFFQVGEVVGYEDVDWTIDHIKELNAWILEIEEIGYEIEVYAM